MTIDKCIYGVLNWEQLEYFCKRFNLKSTQIKANFDGWRKVILYTEDRVFMFPRDPRSVEWLDVEIAAYELLNKYKNLPVPFLIERVKDEKISYYEFAVATRLRGFAYSKYEKDITFDKVEKMLENLAELFTLWHEIPLEEIPTKIKERLIFDESIYQWELSVLEKSKMKEAFDFAFKKLVDFIKQEQEDSFKFLTTDKTKSLLKKCLQDIVSLEPVLIHSDIHEDQILIDSLDNMEIAGILDWETVRIGNPVWEFNFLEWGYGIWEWRKKFNELRRKMWKIYLDKRGIKLKNYEGLNVFYALSEFLKSLDKPIANQENSITMSLESLVEIIKELEK
ncbi:MAG: aminoglycoside phosphotransferase family protein [Candidatus Thorarchaeota archaeon]